ncbi:MAG: PsbP-related protein [Clostridia bacterium]|nr:PsbP-related protein [Clostridia bacterium]
MLFITINKKKLKTIKYIVFIVILLILAMVIIKLLSGDKPATNDNIEYAHYSNDDVKIKFEYPDDWEVDIKDIAGDEILFHIGFHSPDDRGNGFIQIWAKCDYDTLISYIEGNSVDNKIVLMEKKKINLDGNKGYMYFYKKNENMAKDALFSKGEKVIRVFMSVREDWDEKHNMIFNHILDTLSIG